MTEGKQFRICDKAFAVNDDGHFTYSSTEQKRVEGLVEIEVAKLSGPGNNVGLQRAHHANYILKSLDEVSRSYASLDASRAWMCFWGVHSLNVLAVEIPQERKQNIITFLATCQHSNGGFSGGPGQDAHLATTYAAVMALASLKSVDALKVVDKKNLASFLRRMKQTDGSFSMHDGGECDMRGVFCALSVAALCGILTDDLKDGVAEWIISCQTYEGGFGGEPGVEAHGGYAFCAVAALAIIDRFRLADAEQLLRWLTGRQMKYEGGFQGRTNKLVDGCYSFWQAAVFPIIDSEMSREDRLRTNGLFDSKMLEEYILTSCQDPEGGLRDKPDKGRDLYHTCYVLSGLSIAQSYSSLRSGILGGERSKTEPINPIFNLRTDCEKFAVQFFENNL